MVQQTLKLFGKPVTISIRNDGDFAIAKELFLDHQYRFCDAALKKAAHAVIDVGGHLGFFSLYASALNPKVPIYTYEPHEGNFQLLKENLRLNHCHNVQPKQLAVGAVTGETVLQISREDLNHSTVKAIEPTGATQKVGSVSLDRILQKNRIERCDLLKIDCEGAEYDFLYAASSDSLKRIDHLFLEYHEGFGGHSSSKLRDFLKNAGFSVETYPNSKMPSLGFFWCVRRGAL